MRWLMSRGKPGEDEEGLRGRKESEEKKTAQQKGQTQGKIQKEGLKKKANHHYNIAITQINEQVNPKTK